MKDTRNAAPCPSPAIRCTGAPVGRDAPRSPDLDCDCQRANSYAAAACSPVRSDRCRISEADENQTVCGSTDRVAGLPAFDVLLFGGRAMKRGFDVRALDAKQTRRPGGRDGPIQRGFACPIGNPSNES